MRIRLIVFCNIILVCCQAQTRPSLIFFSKHDTAKRYFFDLPLPARIITKHHGEKRVLILSGNDSVITALKFKLDQKKDTIVSDYLKYFKYESTVDSIWSDKRLAREDRMKQLDQLEKLVYQDTIRIRINEIKRIWMYKAKPSELAEVTSWTVFCLFCIPASAIVFPIKNTLSYRENEQVLPIGLIGVAGIIATQVWYNHIVKYIFSIRKWHIRTKR